MVCPYCHSKNTYVLDTRSVDNYRRRRYSCCSCQQRFSTREYVVGANTTAARRSSFVSTRQGIGYYKGAK